MLSRKPPKEKKQATIFDLRLLNPTSTETTTIDLTSDGDDIIDINKSAILCPICSITMSKWEMNIRINHVEECLSILSIQNSELLTSVRHLGVSIDSTAGDLKSEEIKFDQNERKEAFSKTAEKMNTERMESPLLSTQKKREIKEIDRKASKDALKKPKLKVGTTKLEIQSFINSKPRENETKRRPRPIQKPDTEDGLLPSSRKTEIPDLKLLTFTKDKNQYHLIAVDAFCYKPNHSVAQYFLSHFHSDHYGGFTKRWCRERTIDRKILYCSEVTARLLHIRYNAETEFIFLMKTNARYKVWTYGKEGSAAQSFIKENFSEPDDSFSSQMLLNSGYILKGGYETTEKTPGLYVISIDANHCPGASIFLFESVSLSKESSYSLHCGDFRVCKTMLEHPALSPFHVESECVLQKVYLDTTYLCPTYNFPLQETVCEAAASMIEKLAEKGDLYNEWLGTTLQSRITDFLLLTPKTAKKKFLVLVGTYLIGKENLAIAILKKMGCCPIYVSNINSRGDKAQILASFGNAFLDQVLTQNDTGSDHRGDVVVHLVPMRIVGSMGAISGYFNHNKYFEYFEKCIGFRPTGWTVDNSRSRYDSGANRAILSQGTLVKILKVRPNYTFMDILGQKRPKNEKLLDKPTFRIYSLPYSEHLSFRELTYFAILLNIGKIIPTVNTERELSKAEMNKIIEQWESTRNARVNSMKDASLDTLGLASLTLADL